MRKRATRKPRSPDKQKEQMTNKGSEISAETRKRIEGALNNWNKGDSEARKRFEDAKRGWDQQLQHLTAALEASERLTEKDLAFRINTVGT